MKIVIAMAKKRFFRFFILSICLPHIYERVLLRFWGEICQRSRFLRVFFINRRNFLQIGKKLDYSPPLIFKLKFIAFIIFLQNSNRSNMCAAIAQRRLVTRKFQIEENMRIVALKSTQKMPRRICAARC